MILIIRLAKKWIQNKATIKEIYEMIFLIDHYHELDLPYILWGFPDDSLIDFETRDLCFEAPYYINKSKEVNTEIIFQQGLKVWSEYYG
ncbi:hypothetical protein DI487_00160 [Flavobacterium sediminis]|uniref:Uncharacterized protein n=2 Tax=Flavobacterium sediminis TaxID=2201181 RepID=A0A2U8QRH6_9FLAO|nr:hypothetical protein DI487_00160 [Flavobacterium sediminis]